MGREKKPNRTAAQSANRNRRMRKRRGRMTLHYILVVLFVLAAGFVLSLTVFFKVEEILVVGTDKYSSEHIIEASGLKLEDNLFRIDVQAAAESLMDGFPYIEEVYIHRKLPPKVEIEIVQSVPVGAVVDGDEYVLISQKGKLLERGLPFIPLEIPLIKGIKLNGVAVGEQLGTEASEQLKMLDILIEAMEESGFHKITNVDLSDRLNIRVIYENRILLELGTEADLAYKLTFVNAIVTEKLGPLDEGILDVTAASKKKAVFRPGSIHSAENYTPAKGSSGYFEIQAGEDDIPEGNTEPPSSSTG